MKFLLRILTWWNGSTVGTQLFTARKGVKVGEDEQGNIYYRTKDAKRRWVIYNGISDASLVPPGWHGWLHHRVDVAPVDENYTPREWQKPHLPNLTGSPAAYRPKGSIATGADRPRVTGDYDAWTPGG